jgi:hypothetical protein
MRESFDVRVAIGAAKNRMDAGLVLGGIDKQAVAGCGCEILLPVASQASGVGRRFGLRFEVGWKTGESQKRGEEQGPAPDTTPTLVAHSEPALLDA